MKKKLIATLLCAALCLMLVAACNNNNDTPVDEPTATEAPSPAPEPTEAPTLADADSNIPAPAYHFTFDEDNEGLIPVVRDEDNPPAGGSFGIAEDASINLAFAAGPVGNALYIDGTHGVRIPVEALNTDEYTISFWVNADRLSQFGPSLQMGSNIGGDDTVDTVTWLNFTQTDFTGSRVFPTIWNRNGANWPWISILADGEDTISGRREWAMFTLVVTGNEYIFAESGDTRIATDLYINGTKVFSASEGNFDYHGIAAGVMNDYGNFECLFGLNYWDELFKGYVDELYIFTDALSAGQVAYLWSLGDPTVETVEPDPADLAEDPVGQVVTDIDGDALYTIGDPDTEVLGFWAEHGDAYEIPSGGELSITFNNYGRNFNNWDNYVFILATLQYSREDGATPQEAFGDEDWGAAELGVVRGDAFHWGGGITEATYDCSWGDDWDTFRAVMSNAQITLVFTRDGGTVNLQGTIVDLTDGEELTYNAEILTTADSDPIFVHLSGEKMYVEVLEVS